MPRVLNNAMHRFGSIRGRRADHGLGDRRSLEVLENGTAVHEPVEGSIDDIVNVGRDAELVLCSVRLNRRYGRSQDGDGYSRRYCMLSSSLWVSR